MRTPATLLAFAATTLLSAQTITSWTTVEGLPSNDLRDVAVAADNSIWIATQQGVVTFNGTGFTTHTTTTHPGLVNNDVQAIAVMDNGDVWVGTDFGVSVFNGSVYTTYTTADGLGDDQVKNIKQAPNGDVWIGTINGATRYANGVFTAYGSPEIPFGGVLHVSFAPNGDVWMAGGLFGIIVFNGSTFSTISTAQGLVSNRIRSIAFDGSANKWVGTADGISVLNAANAHVQDHLNVFILPPPDELNPITDVVVDQAGRIWAGVYVDYLVTVGGVSVYTDGVWDQFEEDDGLAGPNVRRLAVEGNNIWVATSTGLSRITDTGIGMEERHAATSMSMFPNPADRALTLVLDNYTGARSPYVVHDASGRTVDNGIFTSASVTLNVAHLDDGVYLVRVGDQAERFVVRH